MEGTHNDALLQQQGQRERDELTRTAPTTGASASSSTAAGKKRKARPGPWGVKMEPLREDSETWVDMLESLQAGARGVAVPAAMVASIHGKLRACVQAVEPALFGAANRLWVAAAVHLDSGEGQRLEPGHGVRLPDGEVAQVLAIVASPDQSRLFVFVQIFVAAGS